MVNGAFIPRNAGTGFDFVGLSTRLSRTFRLQEALRMEVLAEAFNALNRFNGVTRNTTFGSGTYPTNPLPAFGQVTSVAEPRSVQFAARLRF
jgi:hypothetical protein